MDNTHNEMFIKASNKQINPAFKLPQKNLRFTEAPSEDGKEIAFDKSNDDPTLNNTENKIKQQKELTAS